VVILEQLEIYSLLEKIRDDSLGGFPEKKKTSIFLHPVAQEGLTKRGFVLMRNQPLDQIDVKMVVR
jgi:hypothetical protein